MDWINKWFLEVSESPAGSLVLFALVFLTRLGLDALARRRSARKHHHHARKPA